MGPKDVHAGRGYHQRKKFENEQADYKRTTVYLSEAVREALLVRSPHVYRTESNKPAISTSQILDWSIQSQRQLIDQFMPTLTVDQWLAEFEKIDQSAREDKRIMEEPPERTAIRDARFRFDAFDDNIPTREALELAGCKIVD